MKLIAANNNIILAERIAKNLSLELIYANVIRFADGELLVKIEEKIEDEDFFIIGSTSRPVNENIMELLLILDSLKNSKAKSLNLVIPYFGYSRQDREVNPGDSVAIRLVANILSAVGVNRVITLDLHNDKTKDFFTMPLDNLSVSNVFAKDIKNLKQDICLVAPDQGSIDRVTNINRLLEKNTLIIVSKSRLEPNNCRINNIKGNVIGKDCIIIDDIVDSALTLCNVASALLAQGANSVRAYVTHGIFSKNAIDRIMQSEIKELVITDSIELKEVALNNKKIRVVSVAKIFSEMIKKYIDNNSRSFYV